MLTGLVPEEYAKLALNLFMLTMPCQNTRKRTLETPKQQFHHRLDETKRGLAVPVVV